MKDLLIEQGKNLLEGGYYNKGAHKISDAIGLKMSVKWLKNGIHFQGETQSRHIFKVTLKKEGKQYSFNFGQSIAEGANEPTLYDVLTCLQKYEVGSLEDFCGDFGYEMYNDYGRTNKETERIYKSVCKEFKGMQRLFSSDELDLLAEIQ